MTKDAIIAGGGPAGAACAIWLRQLGADVLLIEAQDRLGGLQRRSPYENLWIPGVRGRTGQEVAEALDAHVAALDIPVLRGCPVTQVAADGRRVTTPRGDFAARFLVIATGSKPRGGGFTAAANVAIGPGAAMEALDVADKPVAILGGGDNAFDQARFVRDRGGRPTLFSRRAPRAASCSRGRRGETARFERDHRVESALGRRAAKSTSVDVTSKLPSPCPRRESPWLAARSPVPSRGAPPVSV